MIYDNEFVVGQTYVQMPVIDREDLTIIFDTMYTSLRYDNETIICTLNFGDIFTVINTVHTESRIRNTLVITSTGHIGWVGSVQIHDKRVIELI